jgi:hypothetical protein
VTFINANANVNVNVNINITRQIISRKMRWVGHVACIEGEKLVQGFGWKAQRKKTT